jgi:hypothetical protein
LRSSLRSLRLNAFKSKTMIAEEYNNLPKFPTKKIKFPGVKYFYKGDVFEVITLKKTLECVKILSKVGNMAYVSSCTNDGEALHSPQNMWTAHSQVYRLVKERRWRLIKRDKNYLPKPKEKYYLVRLPEPPSLVPNGRFY